MTNSGGLLDEVRTLLKCRYRIGESGQQKADLMHQLRHQRVDLIVQ